MELKPVPVRYSLKLPLPLNMLHACRVLCQVHIMHGKITTELLYSHIQIKKYEYLLGTVLATTVLGTYPYTRTGS